ncbi:MAG: tetratricopeptide repeat protein, partial [Bacteroidia bacterium]
MNSPNTTSEMTFTTITKMILRSGFLLSNSHLRIVAFLALTLLLSFSLKSQQNNELDSLMQLYQTAQADTDRVHRLNDICWLLRRSDTDLALQYGKKADSLAQAVGFNYGIAKARNNTGIVYWTQGDYPEAIRWLRSSIAPYQLAKSSRGILGTRINMGMLFTYTAEYDSAVSYLLNALNESRDANDSAYMRAILSNLGNAYVQQKEYEKAISIFDEGLQVAKDLGMYESRASSALMGRGIAYQQSFKPALAKNDFSQAYSLAKANGNLSNVNRALQNLAAVHEDLNLPDSSFFYALKSLEVQKQLGLGDINRTYSLGSIAKALVLQERYVEAESYLDQFHAITDTLQNIERTMNAHKNSFELYDAWGKPVQSLFHTKAYMKAKDSVFQEKKAEDIAEMEVQYETAEQARQIAERDLKLELAAKRRQQIYWGAGLALATLALLFSVVFLRARYRARQRLQAERIEQQALRLQTVIDTQEKERARIARDLHDGVGQLLASTRMHFDHFNKTLNKEDDPEYQKSLALLSEANTEVRRIAHEMVPRTLAVQGLAPALEELVANTFSATSINYEFDALGKSREVSDAVATGVYRIAQELLQNIVKHAKASEVQVQCLFRKDQLQLTVEDNGIGMANNPSGSGMGLENIHMRAEAIGGKVAFENQEQGLVVRVVV